MGYCQGMNFVTAMLLLFMTEEQAFWCLAVICEEYFAESYTLDMAGSHVDSVVLEGLCREPVASNAGSGGHGSQDQPHQPHHASGGSGGAELPAPPRPTHGSLDQIEDENWWRDDAVTSASGAGGRS
eukprot:COSAG05_NODE_2409_length_3097_cov_1.318546_3_plen_126_part_01